MIKIGNNDYNLFFIDSNVISELVFNGNIDQQTFFSYILNNQEIICFSIQNVLGIKNGYKERWESFVDIFSKFPCAITKPYGIIISEEVEIIKNIRKEIYPLFNHFSYLGKNSSYHFQDWIEKII